MNKEELLAMSSDEYMNDKQLNFFKNLLKKELTQNKNLLSSILNETLDAETLNTTAADQMDRMVGLNALTKATSENQRLTKQIKAIELALKRIKEGEYGYCLNTGDEIGLKRLLLCPEAPFCVEEQELLEKRQKQYNFK